MGQFKIVGAAVIFAAFAAGPPAIVDSTEDSLVLAAEIGAGVGSGEDVEFIPAGFDGADVRVGYERAGT